MKTHTIEILDGETLADALHREALGETSKRREANAAKTKRAEEYDTLVIQALAALLDGPVVAYLHKAVEKALGRGPMTTTIQLPMFGGAITIPTTVVDPTDKVWFKEMNRQLKPLLISMGEYDLAEL